MAGTSLLTLIDDIATLLDDVAVMTKVAAKKTAGVVGDDLALNAEQVAGVKADRELPVVWAVAKGSFINKLILVPAALAISYFFPKLITPLMMLGGAFLCFEGAEKVMHKLFHSKKEELDHHKALVDATKNETVDMVQFEKDKIKGAIRTDFVLSAEIIVITLGTVAAKPFATQVAVVSVMALAMTVVVYGFVAAIVKFDDAGLALTRSSSASSQSLGKAILLFAPFLMKALSVIGTLAMFLVGGSILLHGIGPLAHAIEAWSATMSGFAKALTATVSEAVVGLVAGMLLVAVWHIIQKLRGKEK
jgi:predicted DNA repair protein MutK